MNSSSPIVTKTVETATLCSSLDDNQNIDNRLDIQNNIQLEVENDDIQIEIKNQNIQLEIKDNDIQLELPWDSVDSTMNSKIKPLLEEDMVLPSVNVNISLYCIYLEYLNLNLYNW